MKPGTEPTDAHLIGIDALLDHLTDVVATDATYGLESNDIEDDLFDVAAGVFEEVVVLKRTPASIEIALLPIVGAGDAPGTPRYGSGWRSRRRRTRARLRAEPWCSWRSPCRRCGSGRRTEPGAPSPPRGIL